ncbi:hypothetical protein APHAL10511_007079 [Amanita phalloides]|nr:hypothetical protein APHAL10511_007079 [Amanita phalloides]
MGLRTYDEHLVVVVNPWPPSGPKHKQFINNVSSWFEIILRIDNPRASLKVEAIYQQKTHLYIIVELPAESRIQSILGAHQWNTFLREPYQSKNKGQVSYIYEYNYDTFHHPSRINWYASTPGYTTIDPAFPILSPYPLPGPAPAPRLPYAANLPKHLRINSTAHISGDLTKRDDEIKNDAATNVSLSHSLQRGKIDPYAEEKESIRLLQSHDFDESKSECSDAATRSSGVVTPVKVESTDDDYNSLPPNKKRQQLEFDAIASIKHEEGYQPSEELRATISKFQASHDGSQQVEVKREEQKRHLLRRIRDDEPAAKRLKRERP